MTADELSAAGVQLEQVATVDVVVGYLVTHSDGSEALIRGDRTRADNYAVTHRGIKVEPAFVRRQQSSQIGAGGPIGGPAMPW